MVDSTLGYYRSAPHLKLSLKASSASPRRPWSLGGKKHGGTKKIFSLHLVYQKDDLVLKIQLQ